jgi:glycosyltransferase involved in cell wall biosynthesis
MIDAEPVGDQEPPVVSVILPTYNGADRIGGAIRSVLGQTGSIPLELLVVDDASIDATGQVVQAVGDARIRLLRLEVNRGPYAARNLALRTARGAYVAFIDDDDEWLPDKLSRQLAVFEHAPDVALVHSGTIDAFPDGSRRVRRPLPDANTYEANLWHDCICTSTVVVRQGVFERVGHFDESMRAMGDWDMWTRISANQQIASVGEPLVIAHLRPGSIQRGSIESFAKWHRFALEKRHDELVRLGLVLRAEAAHHYAIGAKLHQQRENRRARRYARASLRIRLTLEGVALIGLSFLPDSLALKGRLALRTVRTAIRR